jgi:hypothetical protein
MEILENYPHRCSTQTAQMPDSQRYKKKMRKIEKEKKKEKHPVSPTQAEKRRNAGEGRVSPQPLSSGVSSSAH